MRVFTDVFRVATEHGAAYELSTAKPTPATARILGFASDLQAVAHRRRFDPLAREGVCVHRAEPTARRAACSSSR